MKKISENILDTPTEQPTLPVRLFRFWTWNIRKLDRSILGPLLETFVFSEVLKQASWFGESCALYHYRDKDQDKVDLVIETGSSTSCSNRVPWSC
jgi:predicted AAA+ superfamily ATPase